ncbi:MAG: hypothetical protein JO189_21615 [Deltaproteobacteria bacterium]|nr:hypothetical protein [Deltaproteobacteria bacterium]
MRTRIWLLLMSTITTLYLGTSAWAQGSGSSAPGLSANQPQVAQPSEGGVNWKGVGIATGAVVSNLAYVPAKLAYGILGGIVGGAGYALTGGNKQVADSIWRSSLGGDYVLTPDMMTGKKPIYFSGPSEEEPMHASPGSSSSLSNSIPSTSGTYVSVPAAQTGSGPATYPIDNGAGPVGATGGLRSAPYAGVNNPGSGHQGYNHSPAPNGPSSPDTSIE